LGLTATFPSAIPSEAATAFRDCASQRRKKETAEPRARRSFLIGIETDDHFQRGTAVRKITAIWEEFAGASSVSTFNMRSLSVGAKERARMAAITCSMITKRKLIG
jgi:hypothetical protein